MINIRVDMSTDRVNGHTRVAVNLTLAEFYEFKIKLLL